MAAAQERIPTRTLLRGGLPSRLAAILRCPTVHSAGIHRRASVIAASGTLTLLLACCTALPRRAIASLAVHDLLRFVPPGFSSLWISSADYTHVATVLPVETEGIVAVAIAGRQFRARGASIEGDCDGVWVWKASGSTMPQWWSRIRAEATETVVVDGVPVWHLPGATWGPRDDWYAVVGGLFLVRATRIETMRQCLQQKGEPVERRLQEFGYPEVPLDAVSVMVCKPDTRPGDPGPGDRVWPFGLKRFMVALHGDGTCSVDAETESPALLREWLEQVGMTLPGVMTAGRVSARSLDILPQDDDARRFSLWRVFGFRAFI